MIRLLYGYYVNKCWLLSNNKKDNNFTNNKGKTDIFSQICWWSCWIWVDWTCQYVWRLWLSVCPSVGYLNSIYTFVLTIRSSRSVCDNIRNRLRLEYNYTSSPKKKTSLLFKRSYVGVWSDDVVVLSTSRIKYFEIITRLKFKRLQSLHGTINFMNCWRDYSWIYSTVPCWMPK